jgi:ribulose-5-phosphate 4-epimerase/fuculose-1-phosphate aldolase
MTATSTTTASTGTTDRRYPPEQVRLRRRQLLAATLRLFAARGFDEGVAGHVTARDPIRPDHFWVNPLGVHFGLMKASDTVLVDAAGVVVDGDAEINPAAYALHVAVHRARPDVVAAAHAHSPHGVAFASLGRPLAPLSQDACAFFEDHAIYADYSGVVVDPAEGDRIAAALGTGKALILANHGLLTVGGSVEEAAWWFLALERCCQVQLLAEAAGRPRSIGAAAARATRAVVGSPGIGRVSFRTLYRRVVADAPELLD